MSDNRLVKFLISEPTVIFMISLNGLALFFDAFAPVHQATKGFLGGLDYCCILYFLLETCLKIAVNDYDEYWDNHWNRFDFFVVLFSLPALLAPIFYVKMFAAVPVLRLSRLFRFFKLMRFIPEGPRIWLGVQRALKASVAIFLALLLLIVIMGMGAQMIFGEIVPEYFGNPLISCYNMFRLFTLENWSEIPNAIAAKGDSIAWEIAGRVYILIAVFVGGVLGLSIANAVFVDEMTADNTDRVENMVDVLRGELNSFRGQNHSERQEANRKLAEEIEHMRKMNIRDRQEANEKLAAEIEKREHPSRDRRSEKDDPVAPGRKEKIIIYEVAKIEVPAIKNAAGEGGIFLLFLKQFYYRRFSIIGPSGPART